MREGAGVGAWHLKGPQTLLGATLEVLKVTWHFRVRGTLGQVWSFYPMGVALVSLNISLGVLNPPRKDGIAYLYHETLAYVCLQHMP